ncbi:undecaprenyl-diphosphate phosphatase [bacterium]|nr:undecaprenyl-diphosphate phosphatase [bacterium]
MDSIQIAILAVVQGITELLPISSTGHMLLVSKYLFNAQPSILLLTILQFGTTMAILIAFKDFLFKDVFNKSKFRLYFKIALATVPAVLAALIFEESITKYLYKAEVIAISLLSLGIVMILVDKARNPKIQAKSLTEVSGLQSFLVGLAQAFAIIPGTSRSGSTTVVGIMTGIERYAAIQFSFLLGLPLLLGSFAYEMYKFRDQMYEVLNVPNFIGVLISFVVGYFSILVLKRFSKEKFLAFFGVYRIILAILIFITLV